MEGHKAHFPHPAPSEDVKELEDDAISEAQIDFLKMLLGSLYGLGQVAVSFTHYQGNIGFRFNTAPDRFVEGFFAANTALWQSFNGKCTFLYRS